MRDKYLNYDTRAQRKDFLLNCKDPHSRLACAFVWYSVKCMLLLLCLFHDLSLSACDFWELCPHCQSNMHLSHYTGVGFLSQVVFSPSAGKVSALCSAVQLTCSTHACKELMPKHRPALCVAGFLGSTRTPRCKLPKLHF